MWIEYPHKALHALQNLFNHSKSSSHLDRVITAKRKAVELAPIDDPFRTTTLGHYGEALRLRFESIDDFYQAVLMNEMGVSVIITPPTERTRAAYTVGQLLKDRAEDNHRAKHCGQTVVELLPRVIPRIQKQRDQQNISLIMSLPRLSQCV